MIRAFRSEDLLETARVWHRSGIEEYTYTPFQDLDEAQATQIFRDVIVKNCDIWVFEADGAIGGYLAMKASYIDRLYVDPDYQRTGIGSALIEYAKGLCPGGLELHTHEQNHRARKFYEARGFVPIRFGISPPPESLPDVEYHWRNAEGA